MAITNFDCKKQANTIESREGGSAGSQETQISKEIDNEQQPEIQQQQRITTNYRYKGITQQK